MHVQDIETDSVLPTVKIMSLSETWVENEERGDITGFKPVSQFKRKKVRAGGVSIYEKEDSDLNAVDHDLLKYDEPTKQIKCMATSHNNVGDTCAVQMELNGQTVLLVNVYISPNTNIKAIRRFFMLNLMAYSPKIAGIFEDIDIDESDKIPIILGGDVNVDLKSENGENLREFLNDNWGLQLNNDSAISTTSSNTCIDRVFTRNLDNLQTQNYISYFSYHKPLLSITVTNETIVQ